MQAHTCTQVCSSSLCSILANLRFIFISFLHICLPLPQAIILNQETIYPEFNSLLLSLLARTNSPSEPALWHNGLSFYLQCQHPILAPVLVPVVPLWLKPPDNIPEKATAYGPCVWACAPPCGRLGRSSRLLVGPAQPWWLQAFGE